MAASEHQKSSYIDYDTFLAPDFSATGFANSLVTSTNNPSDTPIDLSTPLSRVLFDVQEVDTHIHNLTTSAALPLLRHTQAQTTSAQEIFDAVSAHVTALSESYTRLEKDVIQRHAAAEEVRLVASRLWVTLKIGRAASRALLLGRQLDAQMADVQPAGAPLGPSGGGAAARKDDHAALVRAAHTLLTLRALFAASGSDEEGEHLARITVLSTLRNDLVAPAEQRLRGRAQQIVREFSLASPAAAAAANAAAPGTAAGTPAATPPLGSLTSPTSPPATAQQTFAQSTATKARTSAALQTLYLLSFAASPPRTTATTLPAPALLLAALQAYLQATLSSSLASLARALAALPTLPRALAETAARCRNVVSLEALLADTRAPPHAALPAPSTSATSAPEKVRPDSLLAPLLAALETASLPSFFWRSLASALSPRVAEILSRGGAAGRQLRGARESVRESIRDAVLKGCEGAEVGRGSGEGGWDREVGVMVGSVLGPLGR